MKIHLLLGRPSLMALNRQKKLYKFVFRINIKGCEKKTDIKSKSVPITDFTMVFTL